VRFMIRRMDFPAHPNKHDAISVSRIIYPAGDYAHPPSNLFQLRVVCGGSSSAEIDLGSGLRTVFTRPGDLLLSLGNRPTRFRIREERELIFLQASPRLAEKILSNFGGSLADLAPLADRPVRDSLIADVLLRLGEQGTKSPLVRRSAFNLILSFLLTAAQKHRGWADRSKLSPRRLRAVEHAIDAALDQTLTVEALASTAGMGVRAFSAAFKDATGLPVHQFVLRKRVDLAVDLLSHTDAPIADVAHRVGFAHQAHMARVLKRLKNRTPRQIREQARSRESTSGDIKLG
jgi:AraC family transcriptional regulator